MPLFESRLNRRRFLKVLGTAAAAASVSSKAFSEQAPTVTIVVDPVDDIAASQPAAWAIGNLVKALTAREISVTRAAKLEDAPKGTLCIVAAGAGSDAARQMLNKAKT